MSSVKRSLIKTITWRIIGSASTFTIGWGVTGRIDFGVSIGGIEFISKMVLYYLHERAWERKSGEHNQMK